MSERVITSLAILKVNWDKFGHDYIENFVPFVAECLRTARQADLGLADVQRAMEESFGLHIPQGALKTVLKRAAGRGYARRAAGRYVRDDDALAKLDFAETRNGVMEEHEALLTRLQGFAAEHYDRRWSRADSEAALVSYLGERAAPLLSAAVVGDPIDADRARAGTTGYIVNGFARHLWERDPEGFEFLETVVKGYMLANAVLFPDLGQVARGLRGLEVLFDTGFLLRALGFAGPTLEAPCRELLDLLYDENANLRCFDRTLEEVGHVLSAAAYGLRHPDTLWHSTGETLEYFISAAWRASDVELETARLEDSLRALHIRAREAPRLEARFTVDERAFEALLQERVRYLRRESLLHDLDCLAAIHRLRRGRASDSFERCKAIFVTTNEALTRASDAFFSDGAGSAGQVAHCIMDHQLTTLVWIKRPLSAPDLPRNRIIADSYAALNPPDALWKLYLDEMGRLRERGGVSEDDYYLLRFSLEAKNALMDMTLGSPEAFGTATIAEILDRVRAAGRKDVEAALDAEVKRRVWAEDRAERAEEKGARMRRLRLLRVRRSAARAGRWVARVAHGLCIALLALGAYLTSPRAGLGQEPLWRVFAPPAGFLIALAVAALGFLNLWGGGTIRAAIRRLEVSVSARAERFLIRLAEGEGDTHGGT